MKLFITICLLFISVVSLSQNEIKKTDSCFIRIEKHLNSSCPPAHENWVYYNCKPDSFEFKLYNRFGNLVFETNDIHTNWNGETNTLGDKNNLPQGTYFYTLIATLPDQKTIKRAEYFQILR